MEMMSGSQETSDPPLAIRWPSPQPWPPQVPPLRLGVLASGNGSNFEAVVEACRSGVIHGDVSCLVVNRAGCGAQRRAERLGIPCRLIDHRDHLRRQDLDLRLVEIFQRERSDLLVMAGWMRIVTPVLIDAFPERILNIHPSLLPSFRGMDAVGQALAAGVRITGCTAHLVSEEVDAGAILVQAAVPVLADDDAESLAERIHHEEHRILPQAVVLAAARLQGLRDRRAAAADRSRPADQPSG